MGVGDNRVFLACGDHKTKVVVEMDTVFFFLR